MVVLVVVPGGVAAAGSSVFMVADVTVAGLGGCRVLDMALSIF